jgi:hypothetical protein
LNNSADASFRCPLWSSFKMFGTIFAHTVLRFESCVTICSTLKNESHHRGGVCRSLLILHRFPPIYKVFMPPKNLSMQ